ncbi:MAG: asparagine synthase (glutamine-hydrolyzing) [Betaproteobacteria bacterium]|nr:asparagine synthase (glutamine-hydrolyzing) [Betaproteobacteria bacterium]
MCGIVGVLSSAVVERATVERMRDRLAHRGPDHAGLWQSVDGRICLGHRRLSIIDLDVRSNQPMCSHDGRFVVTFNGEIYNFRAVRKALEGEGARFRTESDTEVLLEAFRHWGADLLDHLSGMFAFALWDTKTRRLFCARDRAGEKPLYYALVNETFVFASEIKGLLDWPGLDRRIDYEAMIDFLTFGFVADPKSIWQGVRKLAPAHAMVVELREDGRTIVNEPRRYWSLPFVSRSGDATAEEIRATLLRAANEMAIADVPLGTFLSGGVDSSTVTAALSLSGHAVRSFTIGFDDAAYDERRWARQVADRYRTSHVERTVEPSDVGSVLDHLGWHYDEPFNDYSSVPTYYLCREARRSITVALSGDGADEIFAGYRKYQRLVRRSELAGIFPVGVARALSAVAQHTLSEGSHWRRTLAQYGLAAPQMLADMLCTGFPLPLLRQVARGPLAEALCHYDPYRLVEQLLVAAPPDEVGLVNSMRHLDFALTLPGDILVKVDRASMAVSLEVRPLFLHRDVMELAAGIPATALASHDAAKLALKEAVRPWLPDALIDRPKQGFAMPLPGWLGHDSVIATTVRGASSSGPLAELLDMGRISQLLAAHAQGAGNFTAIVYSAFILDQWFTKWMRV